MCVSLSRCFSSSFWLSIYLVVWELFRLFDGYWAHVRTILPIFIRQYLHRVMTDLCIMNLICDNVRRRVERRRRRKKGSTDLILCILSDREKETCASSTQIHWRHSFHLFAYFERSSGCWARIEKLAAKRWRMKKRKQKVRLQINQTREERKQKWKNTQLPYMQ